MRVLVLNAGSSSLKASVIQRDEAIFRTTVSWRPDAASSGLESAFEAMERAGIDRGSISSVGHRIVHGGAATSPTVIDDAELARLDDLGALAPLHNAAAIEAIRASRKVLPDVPNVGCFDTAFHRDLPATVARYAVPASWYEEWGIRRFGFHGLSVAWAVLRAGVLLGREPSELGLIVAHLGSGCSVTAVEHGRSVATSMGFTPLDGLMMGTRSGSVDPGILIHLLRTRRLDLEELADALEHESGLLGVSGRSGDVRELEREADRGDERAALALDMFAERAAAGIAAVATSLRRFDALVFTGGIGEHAARTRAAIVDRLGVLGINSIGSDEAGHDRVLSDHQGGPVDPPPGLAGPKVLRIEAREDLMIARDVIRVLSTA